jgi:hypothetical protein
LVFTDTTDFCRSKATRWRGVAANYCRILRHDDSDRWKIILHDDVTVPDGLFGRIAHVLESAPDRIVSFYNPTNLGYLRAATSGRHHVLRTYANWWTQCHAFPVSLARGFLEWVDGNVVEFGRFAEDGMLWRFCSRTRNPVYAIVPSLIQHEGFDRSTFGISPKVGKRARNSATYDPAFDVKAVNWRHHFANPYPDDTRKMSNVGLRDAS